jgi:hypothetical protein
MKKVLPQLKYPKLIFLVLIYILTILIFKELDYTKVHNFLINAGYTGIILSGFFYVYEFTAVPATAVLIFIAKDQNIILIGFIAGLGALVSDIFLFYFFKREFLDELKRLSKTKTIKSIGKKEKKLFGKLRKYVLYIFACILIATPLPTEVGVSILATSKISPKKFILLMYILHTLGIISILAISRLI